MFRSFLDDDPFFRYVMWHQWQTFVDCVPWQVFQVCNKNNFLAFQVFWEWHKWGRFLAILAHVTWPRAQPLDRSILLKFSLGTKPESESFQPLINVVAFMVQKLWSQINKSINCLIIYFVCFRIDRKLWTWDPSKSPTVSKDSDFSLVSNKNISKILPSGGLGPGPGEVGQNSLKVLHLWRHWQNLKPKTKNFFPLQSRRLAESWVFEQLSSACCAWVMLVQGHVQKACFRANRSN